MKLYSVAHFSDYSKKITEHQKKKIKGGKIGLPCLSHYPKGMLRIGRVKVTKIYFNKWVYMSNFFYRFLGITVMININKSKNCFIIKKKTLH